MSKLTRDGTAEPVSRDQILRRERGQRIIHFPCSAADHKQDWQPCPVVRAIHTNIVLHTHTALVTHIYMHIIQQLTVHECTCPQIKNILVPGIQTNTNSSTVPVHIYVLTTDTADHEQVWQPYAVDPYYSAISKWWPYLLAPYTNTDHQQ